MRWKDSWRNKIPLSFSIPNIHVRSLGSTVLIGAVNQDEGRQLIIILYSARASLVRACTFSLPPRMRI